MTAIACHLNAIPTAERPAHQAVTEQLFTTVENVEELTDGYCFHWNAHRDVLPQLARFIQNERLCCPFLQFEIHVVPNAETIRLVLRGAEGVKDFVKAEFVQWEA